MRIENKPIEWFVILTYTIAFLQGMALVAANLLAPVIADPYNVDYFGVPNLWPIVRIRAIENCFSIA